MARLAGRQVGAGAGAVVGAGPLPERQPLAGVMVADAARRAHDREEGNPRRHVGQTPPPGLAGAARGPAAEGGRRRTEPPERPRTRQAVEQADRQVQQGHRQQLVVEGGEADAAEQRVAGHDPGPVEGAEQQAPRRGAGGGGGIGEQQVHAEEDGDGDVGVVEVVDAGRLEVDEAEEPRRGHRGEGHRRHPEEDLAGEGGEEDPHVHVRREELRDGDVPRPRQVARAGGDQGRREDREGERGGVEDVDPPAVPLPPDEGLGRERESDEQKLEVEPAFVEPEEQVDAEDDGDGAEAEPAGLAPRPGEEEVEGVGEEELGGDEDRGVADRGPVPAPVEEHRRLGAGLDPVLGPGVDLDGQAPAAAARPQAEPGAPRREQGGGPEEGRGEGGMPVRPGGDARREGECDARHEREAAGRRERPRPAGERRSQRRRLHPRSPRNVVQRLGVVNVRRTLT